MKNINSKKRNYFKGYQENKVSQRLSLIEAYLTELKEDKHQFRNITDLAQKTAEYITQKEKTPCNKSTLLRNKDYKQLLNNYFYANSTKTTPFINFIKELSQSNAERENMRLKQYISNLEKELDTLKNNQKK